MIRKWTWPQWTLGLLLAFSAAGCLDSPDVDIEFEIIEETDFAPSLGIDLAQMTLVTPGVYIQDLTVGEGALVGTGSFVNAQYTGWLSNGTQFDNGQFQFTVGSNTVIPGLNVGIQGMRVGGTRKLVISPSQAYGALGFGDDVPPGKIVVFQLSVLSATGPA